MRISDWSSDVCSSDLASWPSHDLPPDDHLHDFVRTAEDPLDPRVLIGPTNRIFEHDAVAAVQLQASVYHVVLQVRGPPIGLGGVDGGELSGVEGQDRLVDIHPCNVDQCLHRGEARSEEHTSELQA